MVTVDTPLDVVDFTDGVTSLREAVFATNVVGGPDTIEFADALTADGPATIVLTQGEIAISDDLTITGPGAGLLTIDASGSDVTPDENNGDGSRIFRGDDGDDLGEIEVTITGVTLTGRADTDIFDRHGEGGAIYNRECLAVSDCEIRDNSADEGGGIYNYFGSPFVTRSAIHANSVDYGGGIYSEEGNVTVSDCVIHDNQAYSGGGGILTQEGSPAVIGCAVLAPPGP